MMTSALLGAAFVGMLCNWYSKNYTSEAACSLSTYIKTNRKRTVASFTSVIGAVAALVATGVILSEQTLAVAFGIGFTLDKLINKGPKVS